MTGLTQEARAEMSRIAQRHSVSEDAAHHLLTAILSGRRTQAQFNHPEFGGMGQWSQGGMIMIGDMFNTALKTKVDQLCNDLADLAGHEDMVQDAPEASARFGETVGLWWPAELGQASAAGSQNGMRYAFLPETRRLVIDDGKTVTIYDTADHRIGGVAQRQGATALMRFTSQHGLVDLNTLAKVAPSRSHSE